MTEEESTHGSAHNVLAAKLLRDAAKFFRNVGDQNEPIREQMHSNADVYDQMANLVEDDPLGHIENYSD